MQVLDKLKPLALLLLRLAMGLIFISHGYPKLFGNPHQWVGNFEHLGMPGYFAYVAGILEFFGGMLLVAGLFTEIVGLLFAIEMTVALVKVHFPQGPLLQVKNYEFPLMLAVAGFVLATIGAGIFSLDQAIYGMRGRSPSRSKPKS
jgi:putative oxidoreductase